MGMDVYGLEPRKEKGEYFRNNVWWWRRLWAFVASIDEMYSEEKNTNRLISEEMYHSGHCNDGVGLETQEDCDELLNRLGWAIEEGLADHREKEVKEEMEKAKQHNKEKRIKNITSVRQHRLDNTCFRCSCRCIYSKLNMKLKLKHLMLHACNTRNQ